MYCMTVEYPKTEGSKFDYDYYRDVHMPLCTRLFAGHGFRGSVMRTGGGKGPGSGDLNWISLDLVFDSPEQLQAALAAGGAEITADVPRYTDVRPRMSFAEIALAVS
jgi:uncharacterized protein (TIGR02118 family)